jgi:peptide chain release factor 3
MQVFVLHDGLRSEPILAVVGELQFEVLQSRLETEYNVETTIANLPYKLARWVDRDVDDVARMTLGSRVRVATDTNGKAVVLFTSDWELEYAQKENPGLEFLAASR